MSFMKAVYSCTTFSLTSSSEFSDTFVDTSDTSEPSAAAGSRGSSICCWPTRLQNDKIERERERGRERERERRERDDSERARARERDDSESYDEDTEQLRAHGPILVCEYSTSNRVIHVKYLYVRTDRLVFILYTPAVLILPPVIHTSD